MEGEKTVSNTVNCYNATATGTTRVNGNTANFTINNGNGTGNTRKRTLSLELVDCVDNNTKIEGASFKVQVYNADTNSFSDTGVSATTDKYGKLTMGPFPNGKYKIVQTSTATGYYFNKDTYEGNDVSVDGVFEMSDSVTAGVSVQAKNSKGEYKVQYQLEQLDGTFKTEEEETLSAEPGTEVTATEKTYPNYVLNKGDSSLTGTVPGWDDEAELVLVAKYDLVTHTVTYDLNGGVANGVDYSVETVKHGATVTVKDAPTREGYTFTGWNMSVRSRAANVQPQDVLTVTEDLVLTAQWQKDAVPSPTPTPTVTPTPTPSPTPTPTTKPTPQKTTVPNTSDSTNIMFFAPVCLGAILLTVAVYEKLRRNMGHR